MCYKKISEYINILADFCATRDISFLNKEELKNKYNINQADIIVLFGGSIIEGGDIFAQAIKEKIAKKYIIVGGYGHTTDTLINNIKEIMPNINYKTEAEIFNEYIKNKYNVEADFLELHSTNCGNNITNLLEIIKKEKLDFNNIILIQDASMQLRMSAVIKKYIDKSIEVINYAAYKVKVINKDSKLIYDNYPLGMWNIDRYINLLMGEIPRLKDNKEGYGPRGKDFLIHIDIPEKVENAFLELKKYYPNMVREAKEK